MKTTSYTLLILSAILAFTLNFLLNLVTGYLATDFQPYKPWLYVGLGLVFVASLMLLVLDARRPHSQSGISINQSAKNGGKITRSPIKSTSTGALQVDQQAHEHGEILDSPIDIHHLPDATVHQQASGPGSKIDSSGISS